MKEREVWLDDLRVFACVLVALGHLLLSFRESAIRDTMLMSYAIETFYHFHVYIFFFCSGYLLQKSFARSGDRKAFTRHKLLRCLDFIIVYVIFSGVTFAIKVLLSGDVNSPVEYSFGQILLKHPINQMWYLYAIAIITLCTPMLGQRTAGIVLAMAVGLKILICIPAVDAVIPVPFDYLADNQIWYVLGSLWAFKGFVPKKSHVIALAAVFLAGNTAVFFGGIDHAVCDELLTFTGIMAAAGAFRIWTSGGNMSLPRKLAARHLLPIYLLHTICAAGIRIVLLRLGVEGFGIHLVMGLVFSFAVPIACAEIACRVRILNILFYPVKTIREMKK